MIKKIFNHIFGNFIEILASIRCFTLTLFVSSKLDVRGEEQKPNILCVHGYLHNDSPWGFFRRCLKKAGVGTVNAVSYPSVTESIPQNGWRIKQELDELKRITGQDVTVLIGHSQGGVVCLEYALEYAPKDRLTYVIALSSPLHGTKTSWMGAGISARQMAIGSDYLKSLHERLKQAQHIRVLALASEIDLIIRPPSSALLQEYFFAENVTFKDVGHVTFLFSRQVIRTVIDYLIAEKLLRGSPP